MGPYGNVVAAILAVMIVGFWLASKTGALGHIADPALDNVALITIGVVFGTQVVQNGTQTKATTALAKAEAANSRLDALNAPPAASAPPAK